MLNDCGALCGAACCHPDEDGQGGVYLFPGERALLRDCEWVRVLPAGFAPMLLCDGTCDRDRRPLGCRIFPLTARARAVCPLVSSGLSGLDPEFVRGVRDALRIVAEDPEGDAFLERWHALEEEYRKPLW